MTSLSKLKELAQAATPGEWILGQLMSWKADGTPVRFIYRPNADSVELRTPILGEMCDHDAAFIAAANPAAVLSLIERIETMREALEEVALPPYADSNPLSLLQTLMQRAREALKACEEK